ncbi:hypothetical protein CEV32_2601 [Brucella rhizosphaerae]|uniref:Uncharacterized protein n=1 Tax=Brucella rhizosphaerae TaxID=571254 RepID=A0A256F5P4_9HYPH|nr:hypothetical protein CEV32_2601 [Brucella rhizosphaerae]
MAGIFSTREGQTGSTRSKLGHVGHCTYFFRILYAWSTIRQ